jgi:hypothetical protein
MRGVKIRILYPTMGGDWRRRSKILLRTIIETRDDGGGPLRIGGSCIQVEALRDETGDPLPALRTGGDAPARTREDAPRLLRNTIENTGEDQGESKEVVYRRRIAEPNEKSSATPEKLQHLAAKESGNGP